MAKDDKSATDDDKKDDDTLGDAGKRALAAEREARRKAEADLKTARDELGKVKADQDTSKSDLQKVLDKVAGLETRAEEAERKALVAEVAADKKLTPAQARRLQGTTREELESDAAELLEAFGAKAGKKDEDDDGDQGEAKDDDKDEAAPFAKPGSKPKEKLRSGSSPESDTDKSGQELADEVWKRTRGGL
jgi:hypothetical protein